MACSQSQILSSIAGSCPLLRDVALGGCFTVTDSGLASFIDELPGLSKFAAAHNPLLASKTAASLASLEELTSLAIDSCWLVTDEVMHMFGLRSMCTPLMYLHAFEATSAAMLAREQMLDALCLSCCVGLQQQQLDWQKFGRLSTLTPLALRRL